MNLYRTLADVVVAAHFAYVLFVIFGLLATLLGIVFRWSWVRNFWFRTIHLTMIGVVVLESLAGLVCPLTTLENYLRRRAGQAIDGESFIASWVHRVLFYEGPPWVFTLGYCLFGAAVLATYLLAPPRRSVGRFGRSGSREISESRTKG